jgi:enolase
VRIGDVRLRGILDSRAQVTVEAEVNLVGGYRGRGSSPVAIAPGRLERRRGELPHLGPLSGPVAEALCASLAGLPVAGQRELDAALDRLDAEYGLGSAITLAVSLAGARAAAARQDLPLHEYLSALAGTAPALPRLLVNVFSGGIHLPGPANSFQQVMVSPRAGGLGADIEVARAVWSAAAQLARGRYGELPMSASSGLVAPASSTQQLDLLAEAVAASGQGGLVSFGVDVAAEHLRTPDGRYRLGPGTLPPGELADVLADIAARHPLEYLEDPFDPADTDAWRALRPRLRDSVRIVGDDLFATDARRVGAGLAGGILLKLSQAGTLTGTLDAAAAARAEGMWLGVSHRSGETDDTAMCDLAVALGAEFIKVGGPRGDRLAKYNQLLRLAERVPGATSAVR